MPWPPNRVLNQRNPPAKFVALPVEALLLDVRADADTLFASCLFPALAPRL